LTSPQLDWQQVGLSANCLVNILSSKPKQHTYGQKLEKTAKIKDYLMLIYMAHSFMQRQWAKTVLCTFA